MRLLANSRIFSMLTFAIVGLVMFIVASPASAELVLYENFDTPVLSSPSGSSSTIGQATGMTAPLTVYGSGNYIDPFPAGGGQYVCMSPGDLGGGSAWWDFTAPSAGQYTVSFDYRNFGYNGRTSSVAIDVMDRSTSASIFAATMSISEQGFPTPLYSYSGSFNATSAGQTLRVTLTDVSPNHGEATDILLDNLAINGVVPEPGMLTLSAIGLAGLLAYAWRKRR